LLLLSKAISNDLSRLYIKSRILWFIVESTF
jgi:hypothetical protein